MKIIKDLLGNEYISAEGGENIVLSVQNLSDIPYSVNLFNSQALANGLAYDDNGQPIPANKVRVVGHTSSYRDLLSFIQNKNLKIKKASIIIANNYSDSYTFAVTHRSITGGHTTRQIQAVIDPYQSNKGILNLKKPLNIKKDTILNIGSVPPHSTIKIIFYI